MLLAQEWLRSDLHYNGNSAFMHEGSSLSMVLSLSLLCSEHQLWKHHLSVAAAAAAASVFVSAGICVNSHWIAWMPVCGCVAQGSGLCPDVASEKVPTFLPRNHLACVLSAAFPQTGHPNPLEFKDTLNLTGSSCFPTHNDAATWWNLSKYPYNILEWGFLLNFSENNAWVDTRVKCVLSLLQFLSFLEHANRTLLWEWGGCRCS